MKLTQEFDRMFRQEFPDVAANLLIFKDEDNSYRVFDRYRIVPEKPGYRVFCSASDVGLFSSTKSALGWCIADKHKAFNLARDILVLDSKLTSLTSDINVRANIADASNQPLFRETIETKLESKIIRKKKVESELTKCINWAKYIQQRGFNNETVRTGRNSAIKASR
jgi:hypothetical protein